MFFENKSNKIIKWIFLGGILYFIGYLLVILTAFSSTTYEIGYYITASIFYLGSLCKPIGILIIFKFLCDILYKVLKAREKYNKE